MQKRIFGLLALVTSIFACNATHPVPLASSISSSIPQIQFMKQIDAGRPISVAVDAEGRIYAGQEDGTIRVMTFEGLHILTLKGTDDSGRKILDRPSGLAVYDDKVYVADRSADKVVIFSTDGKYLDSFGVGGSGFKEFKNPSGICLFDGIIYVADSGGHGVQVFGPNGVFLRPITGQGDGAIRQPSGVALDHRGCVYVATGGQNGIKVFMPSGEFQKTLDATGDFIAAAKDGFYVADQGGISVRKCNFDGKFLFSFGSEGDERFQLRSISGMCVDPAGKVYVADQQAGLVHIFYPQQDEPHSPWLKAPAETSVKWIQDIPIKAGKAVWDGRETIFAVDDDKDTIVKIRKGQVEKGFRITDCSPVCISLDRSGRLWVLDGKKRRVVRLNDQAGISFGFGSSGNGKGQFSRPSDMAISRIGVIYISDPGNRWVQAFNTEGALLRVLTSAKSGSPFVTPFAVGVDDRDILYVLDRERRTVSSFSSAGKPLFEFDIQGKEKGRLTDPVSLFATLYEVFILDAGSSSIKVFTPQGGFLREFGCSGKGKGDFKDPVAIAHMGENTFIVSDRGNQRLQILANLYSPSPPPRLVAKADMHAVRLTWDKSPEPIVSGYRIFRSLVPNGPFQKLDLIKAGEAPLGYTDRGVEPEKTYYFWVSAETTDGRESGKAGPVTVTPTKYLASMPIGLNAVGGRCVVNLSWEPAVESFVIGYVVSRIVDGMPKVVGTCKEPRFSENSLVSNTQYTYTVASLSSDGQRGAAASVTATTQTMEGPPLDINTAEIKDIFINTYLRYGEDGIGRIKLINNTCDALSGVRVQFRINELMDAPYEDVMESLGPAAEEYMLIKPRLNDRIRDIIEDTKMQAEIIALYSINDVPHTLTGNLEIPVHELHGMGWDQPERFAVFVSAGDPQVLGFTDVVLRKFKDACDNIQKAAVIFNALGSLGMKCITQETAISPIDRIQFPRETLHKKSGDREDLIALYAACLEAIGIPTLIVREGDHLQMLFFSGFMDSRAGDRKENPFIRHEGCLWVPVEVSLVGQPFTKAWEEGCRMGCAGQDEITSMFYTGGGYTDDAWSAFPPTTLPATNPPVAVIKRDAIDKQFPGQLKAIQKTVIQFRGKEYLDILSGYPDDINSLMQMAIIRARVGDIREASKIFRKVLRLDPKNAGALNNMGNIHFLEGRYGDAVNAYQKASKIEPQDAFIWVNLSRCHQRLRQVSKARDCFKKAQVLNAEASTIFPILAHDVLGTH